MANTQINITANGTKTLATAGKYCDRNIDVNVAVPDNGITPSGTKVITTNGTHDVTEFAEARVQVSSGGVNPVGTLLIKENGDYDVTTFAAVSVVVPEKCVVRNITLSSAAGNGTNTTRTILTADEFVKEHYADDGFFAVLVPITTIGTTLNVVSWIYVGNRNIGSTGCARYGFAFYNTSETVVGYRPLTAKISGTNYNVALRAKSTGNMDLYVESARIVQAGEYILFMGCWT